MIGFIGSVFSPWYRWSGRREPQNHVCLNVATYGRGGGRFTMTDRGRSALRQTPDTLGIGPSAMHWDGGRLIIDINEISGLPRVGRVRGHIMVTPQAMTDAQLALDVGGVHIWRPFAPVSRIEVDLGLGQRWQGHGYFDANFGARALEADFRRWTWGRYPQGEGALCFYDAERADGSILAEALRIGSDGSVSRVQAPPNTRFASSLWAVRRETRADPGTMPRQAMAMLDAPFYTRAMVETVIDGHRLRGVHEALDLCRFKGPWLMPMLAMRVPRRAAWAG